MRFFPLACLALCLQLGADAAEDKRSSAAGRPSTLSELGIDFGAAELERFSELGLSEQQKRDTLKVVRGQKSKIDELCQRMTRALKMKESQPAERRAKQEELKEIVTEFKGIQSTIIAGLHSVVTDEQMTKLKAIKAREKREEQMVKRRMKREVKAASVSGSTE